MEDKLINVLEKEAIMILVDKSIQDNTIYEYTDRLDLHYYLKNHKDYKRSMLGSLDLTYINISAEDKIIKQRII